MAIATFPVLSLPVELRLLIWEYCLPDDDSISILDCLVYYSIWDDGSSNRISSLLRTTSQIREECLKTLFNSKQVTSFGGEELQLFCSYFGITTTSTPLRRLRLNGWSRWAFEGNDEPKHSLVKLLAGLKVENLVIEISICHANRATMPCIVPTHKGRGFGIKRREESIDNIINKLDIVHFSRIPTLRTFKLDIDFYGFGLEDCNFQHDSVESFDYEAFLEELKRDVEAAMIGKQRWISI